MSSNLVVYAILASFIQILKAECILAMDTPVTVSENASVCVPVNHSIGETEEQLGNKFQICVNSEFQVFECKEGTKYDVVKAECQKGPHGCLPDDEKATLPPSPQTTKSNQTSSPPAPTTTPSTSISAPTTTKTAEVSQKTGNNTEPLPVLAPSGACSAEKCKLPDCFCLGSKPDIDLSKAPMMIMLTFDDAVTAAYMKSFYNDLLIDNKYALQNPNNCSIKTAFFLSAANTDYKQVRILYDSGSEFASHTVNHILQDGGTKEEFKDEIVGIRDLLVAEAMVDETKVTGFRSPYLKQSGNQMYEVLQENNFHYDSSISNIERKKGNSHLWPYTLDFLIPQEKCPNGPCPTKSFPGLWEIPLNAWITEDDGYCAMIDACIVANTTDNTETTRDKYSQYYQQNFYQAFYPEKVPMEIFTHSSLFLRHPGSWEALIEFMKEVNDLPDVWFLTPSQVLDWMRAPVSNDDAVKGAIPSWNCGDVKP